MDPSNAKLSYLDLLDFIGKFEMGCYSECPSNFIKYYNPSNFVPFWFIPWLAGH